MESFMIFLVVFSVAVVLPLGLLKMILDYKKSRELPSRRDNTIGMAELEDIIRDAVSESQKSVLKRIDRLEKSISLLPAAKEEETEDPKSVIPGPR